MRNGSGWLLTEPKYIGLTTSKCQGCGKRSAKLESVCDYNCLVSWANRVMDRLFTVQKSYGFIKIKYERGILLDLLLYRSLPERVVYNILNNADLLAGYPRIKSTRKAPQHEDYDE